MIRKKGQSLAEYAIVASLIAIVLATMGPGFRRSVQQVVKSAADVLGFQADAEQASNLDQGFLNAQTSNTQTATTSVITEEQDNYAATETEHSNAQSAAYVNGAFIRQ
ncbi:MAG: hypothetical protein WCX16_01865 [Candidatus Omnitrophota bacterium]